MKQIKRVAQSRKANPALRGIHAAGLAVILLCFVTLIPADITAKDASGSAVTIRATGSFYATPSYTQLISPDDYLLSWGSSGSGEGQFKDVSGLAVAPDGSVYAVDSGNNRIEHFTADGGFISSFGSLGSGEGQFDGIAGIAVLPDGALLISESNNGRVQKFDADGVFLDSVSFPAGSSLGGVAVGLDGSIFVVSSGEDLIYHLDQDLVQLDSFGGLGAGPGKLNQPSAIAVGPDGDIWVCDRGNFRIQKFTPEGKPVLRFGSAGSMDDQFDYIRSLAVAADGTVYVSDSGTLPGVKQFDSSGNFLRKITNVGELDSTNQDTFLRPDGLAADREGNLYFSNAEKNRVHKLGPKPYPGGLPGGVIRGNVNADRMDEGERDFFLVRLDGVDPNGQPFYGLVRPDPVGKYLFRKVPLNSTWKLTLIWLDRSRYRTSPSSYSGLFIDGPDRENDFIINPLSTN